MICGSILSCYNFVCASCSKCHFISSLLADLCEPLRCGQFSLDWLILLFLLNLDSGMSTFCRPRSCSRCKHPAKKILVSYHPKITCTHIFSHFEHGHLYYWKSCASVIGGSSQIKFELWSHLWLSNSLLVKLSL